MSFVELLYAVVNVDNIGLGTVEELTLVTTDRSRCMSLFVL